MEPANESAPVFLSSEDLCAEGSVDNKGHDEDIIEGCGGGEKGSLHTKGTEVG